MRFASVAAERDDAAREAWEAEWNRDGDEDASASAWGEDPLTEATIPTTDGPALIDLVRMSEDEWDAFTRGSARGRAGYWGLRRNVAIVLGNRLAAEGGAGRPPDLEAVGRLVAALSDEDATVAEAAVVRFLAVPGPEFRSPLQLDRAEVTYIQRGDGPCLQLLGHGHDHAIHEAEREIRVRLIQFDGTT